MKKIVLTIAILILTIAILNAQETKTETAVPSSNAKLSLSEDNFDFGFVYPGARVSHKIIIKNTGTDTLRLERPRPSCGCTTTPINKLLLAPNESEDLDIIFNSLGYNRPTTKTVTIPSNDTQNSLARVTFSANMDTTTFPKITFNPRDINFGKGKEFKKKLEISITNETTETVKIKLGEMPKEFVNWKISNEELKKAKSTKLTIEIAPTLNAESYFSGTVALSFQAETSAYKISLPFVGGGQ